MLLAEILACNKSALCRSASPPFSFVLAYCRFYLPTKKFHLSYTCSLLADVCYFLGCTKKTFYFHIQKTRTKDINVSLPNRNRIPYLLE